ncbi:MAG: ABC transporter permease [Mycobacteriales bacterium]
MTITADPPVAASPTHRNRPFRLIRHSAALAKRALIKTTRTPEALIDVTIQPVIFLLLFVYVFGGAISGSQHDYLQYLLPGILGQTIAMGAVAIGTNLNSDIEKGVFDRFKSLPIGRIAPLVGSVLADVVRYALVTIMTIGFGYVLGFRIHTDPVAMIAGCLVAIAFALALSWLSVYIGMLVRTAGSAQGIMILIVLPLSFCSNVFVPANTLPGWMQAFVRVNPITHLVDTMRGLFLGGPVASHLLWTAGWMVALVAVFAPLALRAYNRKV